MELAIAAYIAVMVVIGYFAKRVTAGASLKDDFYLAGRDVPMVRNAMSIAATWTWGIALFVSAKLAYVHGWVGLFWFTVPNALALVIFGMVVQKARRDYPHGITMSDYMRRNYSGRVGWVYVAQIAFVSACAYAVQLIFGGMVMSSLTTISYETVVVGMAVITLVYSLRSGLHASIATDFWQYVVVLGVLAVIVPAVVITSEPMSLSGGLVADTKLLSVNTLMTMALPMSIALIAGTFGNHENYQRAYASRGAPRSSFLLAAALFALVPISMGILAMVAAGSGIETDNPLMANVEAINAYLPAWVMVPFVLVLISGLVSTLDSALCSFSSIVGHDLSGKGQDALRRGRWAMAACATAGLAIANIPAIDIFYLWLLYGTYRAAGFAPVVATMLRKEPTERSVFYGVVVALVVGLPLFAYSRLGGHPWLVGIAALLTVSIPALVMLYDRQKEA